MRFFLGKVRVFVVLFLFLTANLAHAVTISVPAQAVVAAASLTLVAGNDINFGTIIASTQLSNVTIASAAGAGTPAITLGNAAVSGGTSGLVRVTSNIDATVNIAYAITGTAGAVETLSGGGNTMAITNANILLNSTGSGGGTLALTAATQADIHIGGVLVVAINQAAATYTGDCVVTVTF